MAYKTPNRPDADDSAEPVFVPQQRPQQPECPEEPTEGLALQFLNALFGRMPAQLYLLIWLLAEKKSAWFRSIAQAATYVQQHTAEDVYAGVALSPADFGPARRCKAGDAAGVVAFAIDLDYQSEAHQKKNLPPTLEDARSLIPSDLPPSSIVRTGHGLQGWWILDKPWIFANAGNRSEAAALAERLNKLVQQRAAIRGWTVDSVFDLARVMRVPDTTNTKIKSAPVQVKILDINNRRYDSQEIQEYVSRTLVVEAGNPPFPARSLAHITAVDDPLMLNPTAEPLFLKFKLMYELKLNFRLSWRHKRPDLHDQSSSGYDQSLATFAAIHGWQDQEIVNLLIAHRRKHGVDLKLRNDYYRLTLGKARAAAEKHWKHPNWQKY